VNIDKNKRHCIKRVALSVSEFPPRPGYDLTPTKGSVCMGVGSGEQGAVAPPGFSYMIQIY